MNALGANSKLKNGQTSNFGVWVFGILEFCFILHNSSFTQGEITMTQTQQIPIVQTGPAYVCPGCGKPVDFARWSNGVCMQPAWNNSVSREWEGYVFYMRHVDRQDKSCEEKLRFARLGDCITPVVFTSEVEEPNYDKRINKNIAEIRAALDVIAKAVRPEDRKNDTASKVVYGLMAGTMTPDAALSMLRDNAQHSKAVLVIGESKIALPDDLANEIKDRAKAQGQSLKAFTLDALRDYMARVEPPDWLEEEMRATP